jgi:hypothetical protein
MSSPTITRGQTFSDREQITNTKLHNLVDLADWTITSQASGDMCYFDGTDWIRLVKGTTGQILTMNTGATAPEWITPPFSVSLITHSNLTATLHQPTITV